MERVVTGALYLIFNSLVPVVMIGLGRWFFKNPPRAVNGWYGYRTDRSMKNQGTWDFAQRYWGQVTVRMGTGLLWFTVVTQVLILLLCPTEGSVHLWSMVVMALGVVALLSTIVPVERALKRKFDENGLRRQA